MHPFPIFYLLAALLLVSLPMAPLAAPQNGQQFRDWTVRCETTAGSSRNDGGEGSPEACHIFQNLLLKNGNRRLLHVAVGFMREGDAERQAAAFFTLPLGVSLPGGLSLTVDDGKPVRLRYERCDRSGCLAPLALSDDLVKAFKGGRWARIVFFDSTRREISVPVSLMGFTAGFDALAP